MMLSSPPVVPPTSSSTNTNTNTNTTNTTNTNMTSSSSLQNMINKMKFSVIIVFILTLMQFTFLPMLVLPTPPKWKNQYFAVVVFPIASSSDNNNNNNNNRIGEPQTQRAVMTSSSSISSSSFENTNTTGNNNDNDDDNDNEKKNLIDSSLSSSSLSSTVVATAAATAAAVITTTNTNNNTTDAGDDGGNDDDAWWKSALEDATILMNDIDRHLMNATTTCGYWKCYYPSLSHNGKYGYVIGQRRDFKLQSNMFALHNLRKSYNYTLQLEKQYNLHHLTLSEPTPMYATKQLAQVLNEGVESHTKRHYRKRNRDDYFFRETKPTKWKRDKLIVQVVKAAPQPNLLIHMRACLGYGNVMKVPSSKKFFSRNFTTTFDIDDNNFIMNLKNDWKDLRLALNSKEGKQLYKDFQFMLDSSGHIWQMDVDRAFSSAQYNIHDTDIIQRKVIDPILNFIQQQQQQLQKSTSTTTSEAAKEDKMKQNTKTAPDDQAATAATTTTTTTTTEPDSSTTTTAVTDTITYDDDDDDAWWKSTIETSNALMNDIDRQKLKNTSCGFWKCYYSSLSNPNYGYLIGPRRGKNFRDDSMTIRHLQNAYELAIRLEGDINNFRHFMVSPPKLIVDCNTPLIQVLNEGLISYRNNKPLKSHKFYSEYQCGDNNNSDSDNNNLLNVQVVQSAPQPNVIISFPSIIRNKGTTVFDMPDVQNFFTKQQHNNNRTFSDEFYTNLKNDWNSTVFSLQAEPGLYHDFQFMLDGQGHIWQIDLDRVWGNPNGRNKRIKKDDFEDVYSIPTIEKMIINPILKTQHQPYYVLQQ